MRGIAALMAALALSACVAEVGDEGLRATALITPVGIAVVPVYQQQPAPAPAPPPAPTPGGSFRP
jgi:hypothetical protein